MSGPPSRRPRACRRAAGLALLVLAGRAAASTGQAQAQAVAVSCSIKVTQLPAVLLAGGEYELFVPGHGPVPLPSSGEAALALELAEPVLVRLRGATYQGSVEVDPAACGAQQVHVIEAAPKPAKLWFQPGAVPLSQLIVSCVAGCPHALRFADNFPELPFPGEAMEMVVEFEFKARGHRSQVVEYKLTPGDNHIRVSLQRVDERAE